MADMTAALFHGQPEDMRVESVPLPELEEGDVLVKVRTCGICGSDARVYLHGIEKRYKVPVILGHEITAEIAQSAHPGFAPRERAVVAPVYGCGECGYCLSGRENLCRDAVVFGCTFDGGYAEYMRVPAKGVERGALVRIDDSLSDEAGTMIEPLACSLHGLRQLHIEPGDTIAIFGSGPIGLSHLLLSKRLGAGKVAMIGKTTRSRIDMALSFGADYTFLSSAPFWKSEVFDVFGSEGVDVVVISAPSVRAMEDGLQITKNGGRLLIFGGIPRDQRWELDPNDIHYREISVHGSIDATIDDVRRTVSLAPSLDLDRFVTHRYTLSRAREAMGTVTSRDGMKVILDLTGKT